MKMESFLDIGWRNVLYATKSHFVAEEESSKYVHSACGMVIEPRRVCDAAAKARAKCRTCQTALELKP